MEWQLIIIRKGESHGLQDVGAGEDEDDACVRMMRWYRFEHCAGRGSIVAAIIALRLGFVFRAMA